MNNQLESRISSREVCEMMEMEHPNLLKKIDSINVDFRKVKIDFSKYWVESAYKVEGQLREYREFQISKRGCEFLAHKTTGTKGNLFTDRYMDRFEQMKDAIENSQSPSNITTINNVFSLLEGTQIMGAIAQTIVTLALQAKPNMLDVLNIETRKIIVDALEKKNNDLANEGARISKEYNDNQAAINMLAKDLI